MTTRFIQAPEAFVVTGIGTSETQITLSNFKTISGDTITQSMIGGVSDYMAMTLSPKTDREEQVWARVDSVSGSNVILDIIRAVNPVSPYDNGGGIARAHNVNDTAVISNNPALFNKLTAKDNNEVVAGDWTFNGDNTHNGEETFTDTVDVTGGLLKVAPAVANDEPYTKLQSDTALALKANANTTVNLTGNQTVAGIKTFGSAPIVPTAVNPTEAVNKSQMEAYIAPLSGDILASDSAFGTTKLDVAADVPADPKALTATANRVDALAGGGDFGTPSGSNKFLTEGSIASNTLVKPPQTVIFTSSGTWNKDAGLKYIVVELVGGGGGGGGRNSTDETSAGSGAGAGYSKRTILASTLGSTEDVTIGAGGTGHAGGSNSDGTAGGATSFGALLSATGGPAGRGTDTTIPVGGIGSGGDINLSGDNGAIPGTFERAIAALNKGGNSMFGTGGYQSITGGAGGNGRGFGSGGAGGRRASSTTNAGGNGAPGIVMVTEYYS